jgi:transposase InsO family protein
MNNHHQNARTTFYSRVLMVQRVQTLGMSVSVVAQQLGVSRTTVYKWLNRYRRHGPAALHNRGSRPKTCPRRLPVERVATIAALRRRRKSSIEIAAAMALPVSTVSHEIRRLNLQRLSRLETRPPVIRYEYGRPGGMIHLDVKKLGRIEGVGHRITKDLSKRYRGAGWEFLHVCVDDHSRLAYGELLPDQRAESCAAFLTRSVHWLGRQGIRVERVMTDNAGAYTSRHFQKTVKQLDVRHVRIRPYTPQTNGKAERFIRTSLKEWAYGQAYESSDERQEHLDPWLTYYNHQRPHTSLNKKPPVSRLQSANNLFDNYT